MEHKKIDNTYIMRIDKGEEVIDKITKLCIEEDIKTGYITGIGATDLVEMGLFNTISKQYKKTTLSGPMEITSLVGNISRMNGDVYLHIHINVSDEKMNVHGGHLNKCVISATGEIMITALNGDMNREFNEEIGLNLYKF